MKEIIVTKNEEGYKLRKLCMNYLDKAPSSFIYKMLRKKNIVLNDHKATGDEVLKMGDSVKLYLSDDTISGFQGGGSSNISSSDRRNPQAVNSKAGKKQSTDLLHSNTSKKNTHNRYKLSVVYEDEDFIFVNKPEGVLSQKAKDSDYSINEMIIDHLLDNGSITPESMKLFKPSVCNRLDRNTSGLILAGKTPTGTHYLTRVIRDRSVSKYYLAAVLGECEKEGKFTAYLTKDRKKNIVNISDKKIDGSSEIVTDISMISYNEKMDCALLEIDLITGKSHQIRAHLAHLGNPIIGDVKYGNKVLNAIFNRKFGIRSQMLTAYRIDFPDDGQFKISGKTFKIPVPKGFKELFDI